MPDSLWTKRKLPHWTLTGAVYFITWRLRDTQPKLTLEERYCVQSAVTHFDHQRYTLYAYAVMDDHLHLLVQPHPEWSLAKLIHSWKSFSSHQLVKRFQRTGLIWQPERFDRVIRDNEEFHETMEYIWRNPSKRWPEIETYPWAWVQGLGVFSKDKDA